MRRLWRIVSVAAMLVVLWVAMAFAAAGDLDTSFNGTGVAPVAFVGRASDVAVGNWKIVAVGWAIVDGRKEFALARYRQNGTLDPTFSGDGKQITSFGAGAEAEDVAIQLDGKIVVAGSAVHRGMTRFAVARYNPNGTLDTTFSGDGKQTTLIGQGAEGAAVAIQYNGRIVVAGRALLGVERFALARYNPNGTLDPNFSGDGKQITRFGSNAGATDIAIQCTRVAIQCNRKILVAGVGEGTEFALARYHRDGTLDTTFSADGKQAKKLAPNDYEYGAYGVALGSGGRIDVVGDGEVAGHGAIALARFNRDGTLDTLFSGDGKQFTLIGDSAEGRAIAIQDDGKIVVASNAYVSGQHEFAAARYLGHN